MAIANVLTKIAGISASTILIAVLVPFLSNISSPLLTTFIEDFPLPDYPLAIPLKFFTNNTHHQNTATTSSSSPPPAEFVCDPHHSYKTELVSLSPLVIYIHHLLTPLEIASLLATAAQSFRPSAVTKPGYYASSNLHTSDRTSSSAGLPLTDPAVRCVLSRARGFLGTMLRDGWDEMGPPQLVRYTAGQRFNTHHDWFETPRWANNDDDDENRKWNRVASFFAILQDNCTGGETWFPYLDRRGIVPQSPRGEPAWRGGLEDQMFDGDGKEVVGEGRELRPLWREHEDGGLAFRPVAGNALFWVNLHPNGTGDERTNHAGLPLVDGLKTAMNIWPRQYYAYD